MVLSETCTTVFVVVMISLLFGMLCLGSYFNEQFRVMQARMKTPASISVADKTVAIESLFPTTTTSTEPICTICLQAVAEAQPCRELSCHHFFHRNCIDAWWTASKLGESTCPSCRREQLLFQGSLGVAWRANGVESA
eukprot:TRINITY_DN67171_c0_g1_i1.p1 TRINITY_DN67171_c0_g1~~TRINITY_DN67171_c0_g1_i1.p1  ORF type:complete len:138 (+),score=20.54 TRINITY_DN67171_c0_g1_i1:68-481(+)